METHGDIRSQGLVEVRNKYIGSIIHKIQAQVELQTGKPSKKWVEFLPAIIKGLNDNRPKEKNTQQNDFPVLSKSNKNLLKIGTPVCMCTVFKTKFKH